MPFRKSDPRTFYSRLPQNLLRDANAVVKFLGGASAESLSKIAEYYLRPYWLEFRRWRAPIEDVHWDTFVLRPHNSEWFIAYVFHYYPEVCVRMMLDLEADFGAALSELQEQHRDSSRTDRAIV